MEEGGEVELLKMDARGRVRVSRERQEALLAEYDRSGMSGVEFARWAGVKYPTFASWLQRRRRAGVGAAQRDGQGGTKSGATLSWVEAVIEERDDARSTRRPAAGLEIELSAGGGVRVRVPDREAAALAAEVLRQLGMGGRC